MTARRIIVFFLSPEVILRDKSNAQGSRVTIHHVRKESA